MQSKKTEVSPAVGRTLGSARLEIPTSRRFLSSALAFVESYARSLGLSTDSETHLVLAVHTALKLIIERNEQAMSAHFEQPIVLEIGVRENRVSVSILNRGVPLFPENRISGLTSGSRPGQLELLGSANLNVGSVVDRLQKAMKQIEFVSLENLGRLGQRIFLEMPLQSVAQQRPKNLLSEDFEPNIEIRPLRDGEEAALSELFYFVYGYNYINEFVYFPEKIRKMREHGQLLSAVAAFPDGRLAGHVGLLQRNHQPPVFEACLGVVDPRVKARGIFGILFKEIMRQVHETPMSFCFFDLVTNHDYSQRMVAEYGACEMALMVGCQSKLTQASLAKLGLGDDPEDMDRYSILFGSLPQQASPFGSETILPSSIGEPFDFLLRPLGINWTPASRFVVLAPNGEYKVKHKKSQSSVAFDLYQPGRQAVERVIVEWRSLMRDGYQYASLDIPIEVPGLGLLYDRLATEGFFMAGFLPYQNTSKLVFRFQALAPTKVAFDRIKIFSESGKKLLQLVRDDYERNVIL